VSIEHDIEPVPGLPGALPPGEDIIWQGAPNRARLTRTAFHARTVSIYFAILMLISFGFALPNAAQGVMAFTGPVLVAAFGLAGVGLLTVFGWASARTTIYTLTNKRVVIRAGIALPTCINVPLSLIDSADLRTYDDGTGDIPMTLKPGNELGYAQLWPHARPLRINHAQPMLRSIPDAARVATLLARATGQRMHEVSAVDTPALAAAA
jgi:hypothetical protein